MSIIVLRSVKGSPLASSEIDANFTNLNNEKAPLADPALTGTTQVGRDSANYQSLVGAVTTKTPIHSVEGTDPNIALALQSKGTGGIDLVAGSKGINISNGTTVIGITRTVVGAGYTSNPIVVISAPTTVGVQATATAVIGIATSTVSNGGTGYTVGDILTYVGGTFTVAGTCIVSTVSSGVITAIAVTATGTYTTSPTNPASVTGGTGSGATFTLSFGVLNNFTITNAGSGYIEQPTITFSGGGGSGAAAYATVGSTATKIQTLSPVLSFITPAGEAFRIADFAGSSTIGYWGVFGPSSSPQLRATSSGGTPILGTSATQSLAIGTSSGVSQLVVSHTASAVNYVQVTGGATTADPVISVQGSDANRNLKLSGKGKGIVLTNQNAPVVKDATATLLIADVLSQIIITSTSATAVTLTLPTGTSTDAGISGSAVNTAFEWSIINTGTTNAVTLAAGATHTIVGSGTVALSTSARFKTVKTATNTFITYRIA